MAYATRSRRSTWQYAYFQTLCSGGTGLQFQLDIPKEGENLPINEIQTLFKKISKKSGVKTHLKVAVSL